MEVPTIVATLPFVATVLKNYSVTITNDSEIVTIDNPDAALKRFFNDNLDRITDGLHKLEMSASVRQTKKIPVEFIETSDPRLRTFLTDRRINFREDQHGISAEFTEAEWAAARDIIASMEGDLEQQSDLEIQAQTAARMRARQHEETLRGKCLKEMAKYGINDLSRAAWEAIKHEEKMGRPIASICAQYAENEMRSQTLATCEAIFAQNNVRLSPEDRQGIMARVAAGDSATDICTTMAKERADAAMIARCERIFSSFKLDMHEDLTEQEVRMLTEGIRMTRDADTVCTDVARIATERMQAAALADIDRREELASHQREAEEQIAANEYRQARLRRVRNSLQREVGRMATEKQQTKMATLTGIKVRCIDELMAMRSQGYPVSDDTLKAINDARHAEIADMICHRAKARAMDAGITTSAADDGWTNVESLAAVSAQIESQAAHNLNTDLRQGIGVVPKLQAAMSDRRLLPQGKLALLVHAATNTQDANELEMISELALAMETDIPDAPVAVAKGLMVNANNSHSAVTPQVAEALITHMQERTANDRTRQELGGFLRMLAEIIGALFAAAQRALGRGYGWVKNFWNDIGTNIQ